MGAVPIAPPGLELVQDGGEAMQTIQAGSREHRHPITSSGEADADDVAILVIVWPFHQPCRLRTVNQLRRAVRPKQQRVGQIAYRGRAVFPVPFYRHQQLVPLVRHPPACAWVSLHR